MRYSLRTLLIVMLLIGAYFGLYLSLVTPVAVVDKGSTGRLEADYRTGGALARWGFSPAAWLDQKVRREFWKLKYHPE